MTTSECFAGNRNPGLGGLLHFSNLNWEPLQAVPEKKGSKRACTSFRLPCFGQVAGHPEASLPCSDESEPERRETALLLLGCGFEAVDRRCRRGAGARRCTGMDSPVRVDSSQTAAPRSNSRSQGTSLLLSESVQPLSRRLRQSQGQDGP